MSESVRESVQVCSKVCESVPRCAGVSESVL